MGKEVDDLLEGEYWCHKYFGVNKSGSIRKPPRHRPRPPHTSPKNMSQKEFLQKLSEEPQSWFELRACGDAATQALPPLKEPYLITFSRTTVAQLKKYLVVRVANYDYRIGLQDHNPFPTLQNSLQLKHISPLTGPSHRKLVLFYQLEQQHQE